MGEGFGGFGGFGGGGGGGEGGEEEKQERERKEEREREERERKEERVATTLEKVGSVVVCAYWLFGHRVVCCIFLCVGCGGRGEEGGRKE